MKRILDVTNVKGLKWPKIWPRKIPIRQGQHWYQWDVIEDELPPSMVKALHKRSLKEAPHAKPPMGFNEDMLPKGAVLIMTKQE